MNLRECYEAMGADFDAVLFRLRSEGFIKKFVLKFVDDPSYSQLEQTMQAEDYKEAFRAAHTIKGVAQNMGFDGLSQSSSDLTECLRPAGEDKAVDIAEADRLWTQVQADYARTISAIKAMNE